MIVSALLAYLGVGLIAGFLAGLLGVGGGMVIVPGLLFAFHLIGMDAQYQQHLALGTSMATILFTGISSMKAHHGRGAVRWPIWRQISPGIIVGTFAGAFLAGFISPLFLKWFFVAFAYLIAAQMLLDYKPSAHRDLPRLAGMSAAGGVIGALSSWVGIGGGSLSVPFMTFCNVPVKEAIGTSAAIGVVIAVAGSAGFVVSGWNAPGLPAGSLGFVYLPGLAGIMLASFPMAKVGAAVAHRLPVPVLKKCFAGLLTLLASKMLLGLI